jgi:hypothetical protein
MTLEENKKLVLDHYDAFLYLSTRYGSRFADRIAGAYTSSNLLSYLPASNGWITKQVGMSRRFQVYRYRHNNTDTVHGPGDNRFSIYPTLAPGGT